MENSEIKPPLILLGHWYLRAHSGNYDLQMTGFFGTCLNIFIHVSDANKVRRGKLNPNNAIENTVPSIFMIVQGFCLAFIKCYRYRQNVRKISSIS